MFTRLLISLLTTCLISPAFAQKDARPVKVFILAGQSNMEGKGAVNTLDWLGDDKKHGHLLKELKTADGDWVAREDVKIWYLGRSGDLTVGYGSKGGPHGAKIGPELGFGTVVGEYFEEPVVLIKTAWGGKDVANDFKAPGSGGPGPFYTKMIDHVREVLADLGTLFPDLKGRKYELAGFVWFQGWNDMVNDEKTAAYTENLAQMIRDVRKDLNAPDMPVVIGELGVDGDNAKAQMRTFRQNQAAVAELPEFKGNVAFIRTAPYYDQLAHQMYKQNLWKGEVGKELFYKIASDRPYHYLGSGKTYYLMGWAFGNGMVAFMEQD